MSKNRTSNDLRKTILTTALELAQRDGFGNITRDGLAKHAGVGMGTVNLHYGTMPQLRRDVMRAAIRGQVLSVIAQGVAMGDKHALKAPAGLKRQALDSLLGDSE